MTSPPEPTGSTTLEEYEDRPVPPAARRGLLSVSAVWLGFPMILTCAVFGGLIVYSLGFWRGMAAIAVGNVVLMAYVGALSYVAGRSGESFALGARRTFGHRGYLVPAAFLSTIVIGWFAFQTGLTGSVLHESLGWDEGLTSLGAGIAYVAVTIVGIRALSVIGLVAAPLYVALGIVAIVLAVGAPGAGSVTSYTGAAGPAALSFGAAVTLVVASFADSGTMTADFTRWSRSGRSGFVASLAAFPFGNAVALVVGGVIVALGAARDPGEQGGNFLAILIAHGGVLVPLAVAFVFVNLGSVCAHCLYNGAVGWSQLTHRRMRALTVVLGVIGVVLAVAGIWTYFEQWLNLLGVVVPPIGTVLILDLLVLPRVLGAGASGTTTPSAWRTAPFVAWAVGSIAALATHLLAAWLSDAVVGIVVTAIVYTAISAVRARRSAPVAAPVAGPRAAVGALRAREQ